MSSNTDPKQKEPSTPPQRGSTGLWGGNNASAWGGSNMFAGSAFAGGNNPNQQQSNQQEGRPNAVDVASPTLNKFLSLSPGQALGNKIRKPEQGSGDNAPSTSSNLSNEIKVPSSSSNNKNSEKNEDESFLSRSPDTALDSQMAAMALKKDSTKTGAAPTSDTQGASAASDVAPALSSAPGMGGQPSLTTPYAQSYDGTTGSGGGDPNGMPADPKTAAQAQALQQQIAYAHMQQMQAQVQLQQLQMAGYQIDPSQMAQMQNQMAQASQGYGEYAQQYQAADGSTGYGQGPAVTGNAYAQAQQQAYAAQQHGNGYGQQNGRGGYQGGYNNRGGYGGYQNHQGGYNNRGGGSRGVTGSQYNPNHRGGHRGGRNNYHNNGGYNNYDNRRGGGSRNYDNRRGGRGGRGGRRNYHDNNGGRNYDNNNNDRRGRDRNRHHNNNNDGGDGRSDRSLSPPGQAQMGPVAIEDIKERTTTLALDQAGCRLLQHAVNTLGAVAVKLIIEEHTDDDLRRLMIDPFGNYLFQKLVEGSDVATQVHILDAISNPSTWLVGAALNMHGTRSVQALVRNCTGTTERQRLIVLLSESVEALSVSSNGNHVVQRCLQVLSPDDAQFVYTTVTERLLSISTQRHGCCVVQRCIDAAPRKAQEALFDEVVRCGLSLMQDQYGNYVVQYTIDRAGGEFLAKLTNSVAGYVASLSRQKFSSNVIEKCLHRADRPTQAKIIAELSNPTSIAQMLYDQYANYVVQRALSVADEEQALRLTQAILPHSVQLKTTAIGRRIMQRVYKRYPHLEHQPEPAPPATDANGLPIAPPNNGTPIVPGVPAIPATGPLSASSFPVMQ